MKTKKFSAVESTASRSISADPTGSLFAAISNEFDYQGNAVSFSVNGKVMVNATEMAKPFGETKKPGQWLRCQQSEDFINELTVVRKCTKMSPWNLPAGSLLPSPSGATTVSRNWCRASWQSYKFTASMEDRISRLEERFSESARRLELFERQKTNKEMELVAINFQLPRYLRQELNIYCNLNNISVREIFTNYLKNELLNKEVQHEMEI